MASELKNRLHRNLWILRNSADFFTWRACKCRLTDAEIQLPMHEYRLRSLPKPLLVRTDRHQDHGVFAGVFIAGEYRLNPKFTRQFKIKSVLDCGANVGYFGSYIPIMAGSQIDTYIAVEPHPGNFSVLQEQITRQQPARRNSLHNIAISDRDGVIQFHWDQDNRAHRIALNGGTAEVPTLSIPTLLDREGIDVVDLVKIDIEAGERQLLECFDSWSKRVKVILIELHPYIDETLTYEWFARCMRSHGFRPFCNPMLDREFPGGAEPKGTGIVCVAIRDDVPLPSEFVESGSGNSQGQKK